MKKILIILTLNIACLPLVQAQGENNAGASAAQSAVVALHNGIDISYMTTGSSTGNNARMDFRNSADYANGVTSPEQQLRVRSNKNFKVAVRCDGNTFSYQGNSNNAPAQMPDDALWLMVTDNKTGGSVSAPFSTNNYASLSATNKDLLVNGNNGGNQTFKVKYKCTPGFNLPAGTYTMNVVFTATQE